MAACDCLVKGENSQTRNHEQRREQACDALSTTRRLRKLTSGVPDEGEVNDEDDQADEKTPTRSCDDRWPAETKN